jgi:site-specific DNA-methyltransferase (adenine-specific)
MPECSVDAVITDPPYALAFMGKDWDSNHPDPDVWKQCWRVLKPGGHLLSFGGTRTWHRLTCDIEDAGFEIRDSIAWLYGNGFPKSFGLSKTIDKRWEGWATSLKPAHEPIIVARKPFKGTVVANVLAYNTGALNIDACRVPIADESASGLGRWPTNVVMDEGQAAALDEQTGIMPAGSFPGRRGTDKERTAYGNFGGQEDLVARRTDSGGASRFFPAFKYQAKAPKSERPVVDGVSHPTVKPLELMRWLVRLVTSTGGVVLDPFAGSGTTGQAALDEGCIAMLCEREETYLPLILARLQENQTFKVVEDA